MSPFCCQALHALQSVLPAVHMLSPRFAWQTQSAWKPGHAAHLGQPALSTPHCPAQLQGAERAGGWCWVWHINMKLHFEPFRGGGTFLKSGIIQIWDLAKQLMLVLRVTHWTLHSSVLWALLFCLFFSLHPYIAVSRSFLHHSFRGYLCWCD